MKDNLCQVHSTLTDTERRLSHICLFKTCPSVFSFCCNTCRNQRHQAHSGKVVSLPDFHKNLNALKVELNRRLRMEAKDLEAQKILQKLKVIKDFRYQISIAQANLLECVIDLGKLHSDQVSQQSRVLNQLEQASFSGQSGQAAQLSARGLVGLVEYNPVKMKLEIVTRVKKNRTKQDLARKTDQNTTCIRQYLVKIIDALLENNVSQDRIYTMEQFKGHLQNQVSHLQHDTKYRGVILRSLRTKLSKLEEYLDQPFDFEEWAIEPQKIEQLVREENEQQMQQITREISQIQDKRSLNSVTNMTDLVLDDDRSVACSIDFSRMDPDTLPIFKERMVSIKVKIKKLENDNCELLGVKSDLENQLTRCNSKLTDLIRQIYSESQTSTVSLLESASVMVSKKKLRLRKLQGINVLPEANKYKQEYQDVLELYNQVVQQHYDVKDKMFSAENNKEGLLEEGRKLKKRLCQQDRQIGSLSRDILQKSQQIQSLTGKISTLEVKLQDYSGRAPAISQFEEERIRIQHQLACNRQELEQFQCKVKSLQSQRKVHQARIFQYQVRIGDLQRQIETRCLVWRQESEALTRASAQSQEALDKTLQEHKACGDILQTQRREVAQLKMCLSQTQQSVRGLQELVNALNKEKEQLLIHNQTIKTVYLTQSQRINSLQQELELRVQAAQKCTLLKEQQLDRLQKQVERLKGLIKQVNSKSVQEFKSNSRQVENLLSKLEKTKASAQQGQRECSHLNFELSNLKVHLQQREEARIQCDKDMQKWRSVFSEQLRKVKEQSEQKSKQFQVQKSDLELNLRQAQLQIPSLIQEIMNKKGVIEQLHSKLQVIKSQSVQKQLSLDKAKTQAFPDQNIRPQWEISEDKTRNQKMASYIIQLQHKIAEIQQRMDPQLVRSKQREIQSILSTLRSDTSTLQQKLRDKDMIQKIYMKEFEAKKQDIIRLKRENEVLRNMPVRREDRRVFVLDKENKKIKKAYMSFDQM